MPACVVVRRVNASLLVAVLGAAGATAALAGGESRAPQSGAEEARAELGRRLFFDPAASRAGMRSCADCHDPAHGWSDRERASRDDRGPTRRHAQTLIDGADNPSAHWDGEFRRVEDLVVARLTLAGKKGGGHGLGAVDSGGAYGGGAGAVARAGTPAPSPAPGAGAGSGSAPATGDTAYGAPAGGSGAASGGGSGADQGSGGGGIPQPPAMDDEPSRMDCPAYGDPEHGYRRGYSAGGAGEREPSDAPPPTADGGGSDSGGAGATSAPPPRPDLGASPASRPAGSAPDGAPAGRPSAARLDPYADDAFGTAPEDGLDFVASDVDLARLPAVGATLEAAGRYREAFVAAFGSPQITTQRVAEAIGAHCREIRSGRSAYDRFAAGEESALMPAARRGLELFRGQAGCASCHAMTGKRAPFTDYRFHDTGVSWREAGGGPAAARGRAGDDLGDIGAMGATSRREDRRAFKTPTRRDVARRGPFMHDGSVRTLEAAVRRYLSGPLDDPSIDERMPKIVATAGEVADLVAFLRSLTSDELPGRARDAWSARAERTTLRLVDADGRPLADHPVTLAPAGDALPGAFPAVARTLVTDDAGRVEFTPGATTHVRVVLEGGLRPVGGALVPDTCRSATIQIPVRGRCRVLAVLPAGEAVPAALVAEHPEARFFPDRRTPRTILRLEAQDTIGDGRVVAMYAGSLRTDVPARSVLRLPTAAWGLDRLRVVLDPEETVKVDLSKRR